MKNFVWIFYKFSLIEILNYHKLSSLSSQPAIWIQSFPTSALPKQIFIFSFQSELENFNFSSTQEKNSPKMTSCRLMR